MNEQEDRVMKCEDIQGVLFDYMTRELGESRSDLVREHLRRCPACSRVAAQIQETRNLLQQDATGDLPEHLSDEHRARIVRSIMHPALDWIFRHHVTFSLIMAAIVIITALCVLRMATQIVQELPATTPEVVIGGPGQTNPAAHRE
jgi:predicted anti-sigma-YlaC factor YlaD